MAVERKLIKEHKKRVAVREFLHKETERAGFGGADIQRTPMGTRVNLVAERPGFVIGRRGATIKKLTDDLRERYGLDNPQIEVAEDQNPSLNAQIMALKLAEALERGWHFRRAGHSTLRRIMDSGAKGCLITLTGKITGGRSRLEKFKEGRIKFTGDTALTMMEKGYAVCKKKLGVIGVKVAIMRPHHLLPDEIVVRDAAGNETAVPGTSIAQPTGEAAPGGKGGVNKTEAAAAGADTGTDTDTTLATAAAPRKALKGDLTDIPGVGKAKAQALEEAGFLDLKAVDEATEEELAAIEGVGPRLAKRIKEELNKMRK